MSTSPRIARAARCLGVASASAALVFGVAGNAMASTIKDFSAVAECDGDKGVIRVTDVDPLGVTAEVTVYLENNGADLRKVGTQVIEGSTAEGVTVTFEEKWKPKAEYRIHIAVDEDVDEDLPILVAPDESCKKKKADDSRPAPSKSPGKPAGKEPAKAKKSPTPPASETTPPAGSSDNNNLPSPEGDSNLAETGADSHTGLIAGGAAALVALGAGAVYYSMRRRGSSLR